MSKHQIIYTSSKRGIETINDGQHIHSYDEAFKGKASDNVKSLFTYQTPNVTMTDDIVGEMPQAFLYRRLPDGSCAIVLNTYLGRDYMGQSGRFGNHLSHVIICDESDLNSYPCEFYGSDTLRDHMDFDEVNSSEQPPFLPEPELRTGYTVNVENVSDFLSADGRMEAYKKMLAAMLSFEEARKRVVICDTVENIVMWIAALQYALPLKLALNVNFSTYDYNPELSVSQICGVIREGTGYNVSKAGIHHTFDFFSNVTPNIETEGDFFDFIDMGMSMSFSSVQAFHGFICEKLMYQNPNEKYYDIYSLYCLFADGLDNISLSTFKKAMNVSEAFALDKTKDELVCKLTEERDFILSANNDFALEILRVILSRMKNTSNAVQESIKALLIEKAVDSFVSVSANENSFLRLFSEIESLARASNILIPYELMKATNREKLLSAISHSAEQWRWNFIIDILCDYVTGQSLPAEQLSANCEMGQLIGNIIKSRVSSDANNGFTLVTRAINKFENNWNYIVYLGLNLESTLTGFATSTQVITATWKYIYQTIAKRHVANRIGIYTFFLTENMPERVFQIFNEFMGIAENNKNANELFREQLEIKNDTYLRLFQLKIFECYYDYLTNSKTTDVPKAQRELLRNIMARNISPAFTDDLITTVLSSIPIENTSRENGEIVESVLTYYKRQNITGRLLLLVSGAVLSKIKSKADLVNAIKNIHSITGSKAINLTGLSVADSEKYIGWVAPRIYACCDNANDLLLCYKQFTHSKLSSRHFIGIFAKEAFKESKGDKEYGSILVYLEFLFNVGGTEERQDTGEILSKLNKQKLENLDGAAKYSFKGNSSYLTQWDEVREIAAKTNPLLRFFKRK